MLNQVKNEYDVIVVGAGHAGVEAAYASSSMHMKTLLTCLNFKMASNMPCNPHIGGSAKGIVVREIDALGGIMGKIADMKGSLLQIKELNTSKGPGVRCLRAQEDKIVYPRNVQNYLLTLEDLDILESEVKDLVVEDNKIKAVVFENGSTIRCKAVILACGTHMESRILRGHVIEDQGPDGERSSHGLSKALSRLGIKMLRLKTGTPPRILTSSIDFSNLKKEEGQTLDHSFSYDSTSFMKREDMLPCYLTYTNEKTHQIIREHLLESAMYGGVVEGVGPRYCPSIEDKVVRFSSKNRHQLFIEPESVELDTSYIDGLSTSMPIEVQEEIVHSISGLEQSVIKKYAYAIEYDAIEPSQLSHTLELRDIQGIYVSGQIAGTSGYEEAAALGLIAGINASLKIQGKEPLILKRDQAYIGIMIDDIVTKGSKEPYRLLSSRSEYRLLTRSDNADTRLLKIGYEIGLNSKERYERIKEKDDHVKEAIDILDSLKLGSRKEVRSYLLSLGYDDPNGTDSLKKILRKQNVKYQEIQKCVPELPILSQEEQIKCETVVKYEGYIALEEREAKRRKSYQDLELPNDLDYKNIQGLSLEAREKLAFFKPKTLGEASLITNVHPSDIDVLSFYVRHK